MHESEGSDLRNAAARINAERSAWDGVGFMAIENLETGACGLVLVPKGTPRPDWSKELQEQSAGNAWYEDQQPVAPVENAWERHEDLQLAQWLPRCWGADLTTDDRFPELMNLLKLHLPAALVAKLPAPSRRLACGRGFNAHTVKSAPLSDDLRARLVAWLSPWQPMVVDTDGRYACNWWDGIPAGTSRMWHPCSCVFGAAGRTNDERIAATGAIQWGLITSWSSVIDAVVAYLLAMADTLDAAGAAPSMPAGGATKSRRRRKQPPLSKARCHVVLVAVFEKVKWNKVDAAPPTALRQQAAFTWALENKASEVIAVVRNLGNTWVPSWWIDCLVQKHSKGLLVSDLLHGVKTERQFRTSVRYGLREDQRNPLKSV